MSAVLVSSDMLVSSRVMSTARQAGVPLAVALSAGDLKERLRDETRLVMLDLAQPGLNVAEVVAVVRSGAPAARIIAFGPHVDEGLLASAQDAGCDVVMSNGQFHREQEAILAKFCGGG